MVSGLQQPTKRPVKTRFRCGSGCNSLTLPGITTRWLITQKARSQTDSCIVLEQLVGTRFQVLFHSPRRGTFHLSLTVLVHYRLLELFSLAGWPPQIHTGFHVSRATQVSGRTSRDFTYRAVTFYGASFQMLLLSLLGLYTRSYNPADPKTDGLGCSRFARHYSGNRISFSCPAT